MMNPYSTRPNNKASKDISAVNSEGDKEEQMKAKSLPFVPLLPDDIKPPPLPLRNPPLAPRKRKQEKKQVLPNGNPSSSSLLSSSFASGPMKDLSLLGMVSLEMAHQHLTSRTTSSSIRLPTSNGPEATKKQMVLPKTSSMWTQTTNMSDLEASWSIGNLRSFPPPPPPPAILPSMGCLQLGDSFVGSPPRRPSNSDGANNNSSKTNDDMMTPSSGIPSAPAWGRTRQELTVSPCATPPPLPVNNGGANLPSYRLPRRDQGERSQKGRHCLILPQI